MRAISYILAASLGWLLLTASPSLAEEGSSCPIAKAAPRTISTSTYTLNNEDQCSVLVFIWSATSIAVAIPLANELTPGFQPTLLAQGNSVVLTPASGTINGQASVTIPTGNAATIYGNGTAVFAATGSAFGMATDASNAVVPQARANLGITKDVVYDFGCVGDSFTDNSTCFTDAMAWAVTVGGSLHVPAATGCYLTGQITIPVSLNRITVPQPNIRIYGDGRSSCIMLKNGANQDLIVTENFNLYVHRKVTSTALSGTSAIVVSDTAGLTTTGGGLGGTFRVMLDTGGIQSFTILSVDTGTNTVTVVGTLNAQVTAGNPWWDGTNFGAQNVVIERLYLDGNVANQAFPSNIAAPQTVSGGTTLVLQSAEYTPWENQYVLIYSSGNDSARTFTVTGTRRNKDGTSSAQVDTVTGGNAKFGMTTKAFETVTQIAIDGAAAGTVQAGTSENTGNGFSIYGPFPTVRDVVVQNTMGWCGRIAWGGAAGNALWAYSEADYRIRDLNCNSSYGGGFFHQSTGDGTVYREVVNYAYGDAIKAGRLAAGLKMNGIHVSGGLGATDQISKGPGPASGRTIEPLYGVVVEADTVECEACSAEDAILANVVVRNNQMVWKGGSVFHNDGSGDSRTGFQIGDTANGWTSTNAYQIDSYCRQLSTACINFDSDGGFGRVDVAANISAPYAAGPAYIGTPLTNSTNQSTIKLSAFGIATGPFWQDRDTTFSNTHGTFIWTNPGATDNLKSYRTGSEPLGLDVGVSSGGGKVVFNRDSTTLGFGTNNAFRFRIGATGGLYAETATGTDTGAGTVNVAAAGLYDNGAAPTGTATSGYVRAASPTMTGNPLVISSGGAEASITLSNASEPLGVTVGVSAGGNKYLMNRDNNILGFGTNNAFRWRIGATGGLYAEGANGTDKGAGTLNLLDGLYNNGKMVFSATAPTIASGGCTTGSAQSISASNGTAAFEITLGGATCGSTITLTMPAATANWVCDAHNITTPASNVLDMTGVASTTAVVLTNYVRTTGVAGNFTGAEKLAVKCSAY